MSRRYRTTPAWEYVLLTFTLIGGGSALVFLLIALAVGVRP